MPTRTLSVDESVSPSPAPSQQAEDDTAWSSDYTNSEEDEPPTDHVSLVCKTECNLKPFPLSVCIKNRKYRDRVASTDKRLSTKGAFRITNIFMILYISH